MAVGRRNPGTAAHSDAVGRPLRESASCSTPTMPVGPSYRDRSSSKRSISVVSVAVPMIWVRRVWGTSANNAPSVKAVGAPSRCAMLVSCSQNMRHRSAGSGPSTNTTSVPGSDAAHTPTVGHTIERWRASSRRTWGRTVAKSVNGSGSISARAVAPLVSINVRTALEPASPASFQPVKAATTTGLVSVIASMSANQRTCSMSCKHPTGARPGARSRPPDRVAARRPAVGR